MKFSTQWSSLAFACVFVAMSVVSAPVEAGARVIANKTGQKFLVRDYGDGARRNKYAVIDPTTGRPHWYSQTGATNSGLGESGRRTSSLDWCRVRHLYGDDVRIPECWGSFMYSSHLITGINGEQHFELWFSPSSLSYYKIRNQRTGVWYAHDGSDNAGRGESRKRTTKGDWCRIIIYHGNGILKVPDTCTDILKSIAAVTAGIAAPAEVSREVKEARDILEFQTNFAVETAGNVVDALNGDFSLTSVGVGVAVGYGTKAVKKKLGLSAEYGNAGEITAEILSTTAVNTSVTTMIMMASGSSFNPVTAGVGFAIAGAVEGGKAIYKASKDTGIQFRAGYQNHPRYNRDLNGIADHNVAQLGICSNSGCKAIPEFRFNALAYTAAHGDLIRAFGLNEGAAADHYFQNGYREGRNPQFNHRAYADTHPDLKRAFGYDVQSLARHCITHGFNERRRYCGK